MMWSASGVIWSGGLRAARGPGLAPPDVADGLGGDAARPGDGVDAPAALPE